MAPGAQQDRQDGSPVHRLSTVAGTALLCCAGRGTVDNVFTVAAQRSRTGLESVACPADLRRAGWSEGAGRAQLAARRWQRFGRAVVLHGGPLTPDDRRRVAVMNCGERALLTAFTAAELHGLRGWEQPTIHVLLPAGTRVGEVRSPVRLHYVGDWTRVDPQPGRRLHRCAPALVVAASTFGASTFCLRDPRGGGPAAARHRRSPAGRAGAGPSDAASPVPPRGGRRHRTGRARHE